MTIDLFAASFICRDAELGAIMQIGGRGPGLDGGAMLRPRTASWLGTFVERLATLWRRDRAARPA